MECLESSSNYPRSVCGANKMDTDTWIDRSLANEDSFRCTFFRRSNSERSNERSLSSDTCTDSDSEPDELPITRSVESHDFPGGSEQPAIDENESKNSRSKDAPRVRFCAPVCIDPTPRKRWMQGGTGCVPAKLPRVVQKSSCTKKNCSAMREKQRPEFARVPPEKSPRPAGDAIGKGENAVEDRILKNRRLLKSIEEMIRTMTETKMEVESRPCIEPSSKMAKTNLVEEIISREQGKRFKETLNDTEEMPVQRPFFKNRKLEKHLDESMRKAVAKYRTCWKWGEPSFLEEERHAI